jgi:hypothetical protein
MGKVDQRPCKLVRGELIGPPLRAVSRKRTVEFGSASQRHGVAEKGVDINLVQTLICFGFDLFSLGQGSALE